MEGEVVFSVSVEAKYFSTRNDNNISEQLHMPRMKYNIDITMNGYIPTKIEYGLPFKINREKSYSASGISGAIIDAADEDIIKRIFGSLKSIDKERGIIFLSYGILVNMHYALFGSEGTTSDISGNFGKMLYLSASTITTLGPGDIVPVTGEARAWITLEAVTGVVLIGLFLNSLSRHNERPVLNRDHSKGSLHGDDPGSSPDSVPRA